MALATAAISRVEVPSKPWRPNSLSAARISARGSAPQEGGAAVLEVGVGYHRIDLINRMIKVKWIAIPRLTRFIASMAKEIERKFLVRDDAWREGAERALAIRQFYLVAAADRTVRVRIVDGASAMLTLKFGAVGLARDEFEYPISLAEAAEMQAFAIGRVIEKTRHHVHHGGHLYEVDVFGGDLAGLVIAELEDADAASARQLPPWLGREVTGEPAYYNAALALAAEGVAPA